MLCAAFVAFDASDALVAVLRGAKAVPFALKYAVSLGGTRSGFNLKLSSRSIFPSDSPQPRGRLGLPGWRATDT